MEQSEIRNGFIEFREDAEERKFCEPKPIIEQESYKIGTPLIVKGSSGFVVYRIYFLNILESNKPFQLNFLNNDKKGLVLSVPQSVYLLSPYYVLPIPIYLGVSRKFKVEGPHCIFEITYEISTPTGSGN